MVTKKNIKQKITHGLPFHIIGVIYSLYKVKKKKILSIFLDISAKRETCILIIFNFTLFQYFNSFFLSNIFGNNRYASQQTLKNQHFVTSLLSLVLIDNYVS